MLLNFAQFSRARGKKNSYIEKNEATTNWIYTTICDDDDAGNSTTHFSASNREKLAANRWK